MDHLDAEAHTRGLSRYVDDEPAIEGMLHAAVLGSPVAHGRGLTLDPSEALELDGVVRVLTAADIPGLNQVGAVIQDEPLLAEDRVHYRGQPVAVVVATDPHRARRARELIEVELEELEPIVDPREAYRRGELIAEPQEVEIGDVDGAWEGCDLIVEGECDVGGQEHVYLETQRARALPGEDGSMLILSSTQSPYAGQRIAASVLDVPMRQVEVDVRRLGGAFGGKEDQATPWACVAALAARATGRPVELVLQRTDDLAMTGKRHPYRSDFKLGLDAEGRILAYEVRHFQDAGAACDLSLAVLQRTVFHSTNSYAIPNARIWGVPCRTNLPPNTAFRGFGGPQGMFVIEAALAKAARALGLSREELQRRNLISSSDRFPYGQKAETVRVRCCWDELDERVDLEATRERIRAWNRTNRRFRRGMAVMPVTFGISFTATFMNQAGALLHVYTDGSVSLSTGGIEMGQGLSTNLAVVAARAFGIRPERIRIESTNTRRVANMSPSAASSTTLLNGNAVLRAVAEVRDRLLVFVADILGVPPGEVGIEDEVVVRGGEPTDWTWERLVAAAYRERIDLSAHGFFATPKIFFDLERGRGDPFAYHVCGAALVEASVDTLLGRYRLDAVHLVHDLGRSLNRTVDLGQIEGGLAQGLGWMTVEELRYDERGRILSGALATYKVPDVDFAPELLDIHCLEDPDVDLGPYHSKAVGEPPLMYGIGAWHALRNAMEAHRPDLEMPFVAPLTPERVLLQLHPDDDPSRLAEDAREAATPATAVPGE